MRTILLLLIAATAYAQNDAFFFDPASGTPAGGDVIRFVTSPPIDFRAATPVITFGGTTAQNVTVIDSHTLTAVTPPHAEAISDVTMTWLGVTYTTFRKFGYARARDPLLVPVAVEVAGGFGTRWTTDINVFNDSNESVNLVSEVCFFIGAPFPCGSSMVVAPHSALQVPPRGYPEMYLNPPNDVRGKLHFNVRVRNAADPNDLGTEIPLALPDEFRDERVVLPNVPVSSRFRGTLRVYDQFAAGPIDVRVYDARAGALLTERNTGFRSLPTDNPLRFTTTFYDLLNDVHTDLVRIEIEESRARVWAMLTLTENATQRVTVLTSQ